MKAFLSIPAAPADIQAADLRDFNWDGIPALPPFQNWDGTGLARWQTTVRVCANAHVLLIHFACDDADIWGNYTQRDDPIYDEEVVEFFIGAGEDTPVDYFEFEISPNGVLFDARVHNTLAADGHRAEDMTVDAAWNCEGATWFAERDDAQARWHAGLALPWQSLLQSSPEATAVPKVWRANFYRIERPRNSPIEYSAWSPPLGLHPDFHRAAQFGTLVRE